MNWRVKTLVGILLILLGLLVALFEAGLLIFCAVDCPEGRQFGFVLALILAGLALAVAGVFQIRRARVERQWVR